MDLYDRQGGAAQVKSMEFQYDSGGLLLYRNSKRRAVAVESI